METNVKMITHLTEAQSHYVAAARACLDTGHSSGDSCILRSVYKPDDV